MQGTLSIIATPIGNLEDITLRALRVLKEADTVLCEDTRVTKKLLAHYEIEATLKRCDAEKEMDCASFVYTLLQSGKRIAYVTDAGTPGIHDPGARLVAYIRERLPQVTIEAVPGPSAVTAALSIAGIPGEQFTFLGFVPHKKGRKTFFQTLEAYAHPVIFYESPHRIMKTLQSLNEVRENKTKVTVVRELTKMHEEVVCGSAAEALAYFNEHTEHQRGEFVVIVS